MKLHLPSIHFLLYLGVVLWWFSSCTSRTPPVGVILIDTDLPALYEGKQAIGITLDMGNEGKDMLSDNLLLNGTFDLAPRLPHAHHNPTQQTVTTPNQYTTYYPLPQNLHGWQPLTPNITLTHSGTSHSLLLQVSAKDSVASLLHTGFPLSVEEGDELRFTCSARVLGSAQLTIQLVDEELNRVSNTALATSYTEEWSQTEAKLTVHTPTTKAALLIELQAPTQGQNYHQADDGTWLPLRHSLWLDNCHLSAYHHNERAGIDAQLFLYLKDLAPQFLRYPAGSTINGFYLGTYPLHLDSLTHTPIWTTNQTEYTGHFTYKHFAQLAKNLNAIPVLLTNFGFTQPQEGQRIEGLKLLEERSLYISQVFQTAGNPELIIQPGYNLTSTEYTKRFQLMLYFLSKNKRPTPHFITGGALTPELSYSDYTTDVALSPISLPNLATHFPSPHTTYVPSERRTLGEVHFTDSCTTLPLLQRVALLIEAENYSASIEGLSLMPTLASPSSTQLPLFYYHATHFQPTLLYHYLLLHTTWRGELLRKVTLTPASTNIYYSLTSDPEGNNYYLKVANITRHPLPYLISLTGLYSNFKEYQLVHYTPELGQFQTEAPKKLRSPELHYNLAPYEVAIFHFRRNP